MYLFLDLETRCELDITEVGAYKYVEHDSLEIVLFAYAFGDSPVKVWEVLDEPIPKDLETALSDPFQILCAWNGVEFDRLVLNKFGWTSEFDQWIDPMIMARHCSMPGKLDSVAKILNLQNQKLKTFFIKDESMVQMFCTPLKIGGYETLFGIEPTQYRDKHTHPKEWAKFKEYAAGDIEALREAYYWLRDFPLPDREYEFFQHHEKINSKGVYVDQVLLQGSSIVVEKEFNHLRKKFLDLTGISNPRSNPTVLKYVRERGYTFSSINKVFVKRALNGECNLTPEAKTVLELRLQLGKSGVSKLESCRAALQKDGRVRGLFNFMGAARTGRDSSALTQLQNLPKPVKEVDKKLERALTLLKNSDYETIKKEFSSPLDVATASLRPIFIAPKGKTLAIADLSAIEARGSAWLADSPAFLDIFYSHELDCKNPREDHKCCPGRDPYLTFAALMDGHATYEELYKAYKAGDKTVRTNAKPPMLGFSYGLGVGEILQDEEGNTVKTGLLGYGSSMGIELTPEYAQKAIQVSRQAYPEVPQFWWDLEKAFIHTVETGEPTEIGRLNFDIKKNVLRMWLPSERAVHYINPVVEYQEAVSKRGKPYKKAYITVEGQDQKTRQWTRIQTRGPRLFENAVQAMCRDILFEGIVNAAKMGYDVVMRIHDELVAEIPENGNVDGLIDAMTQPISYLPGFPLGAAGYISPYYKKD